MDRLSNQWLNSRELRCNGSKASFHSQLEAEVGLFPDYQLNHTHSPHWGRIYTELANDRFLFRDLHWLKSNAKISRKQNKHVLLWILAPGWKTKQINKPKPKPNNSYTIKDHGSVQPIHYMNWAGYVPKDKAVKTFIIRNIVEDAAVRAKAKASIPVS